MKKPYTLPITKVFADVKVPEPRISRILIPFLRPLGRLYLFLFYGVARIVLNGEQACFDAFKRALSKESRCIVAFRHPNGGEPQLLSWFFLFKFRKLAARRGIRFATRPHAVMVYGYEVVRWGGWVARFVMPRLGGMPIHHAKMDSQGMARIYKAITDGPYPVALAPEGQVSYTCDEVPRLEPGVIRMGFNAAERLAAKNSQCPVEILPVSVHFRFGVWGGMTMELLLRRLEKNCGFSRFQKTNGEKTKLPFEERLRQCREHILAANEERYQIKPCTGSLTFNERLDRVINAALETAERMLALKSEGEYFSRLYRLRQHCWDRIYLPGIESFENMSYIERSLKDLRAGEAWYIGRHQELADFCWYFRRPLPTDQTALHNRIEYVQNLWDFASRTIGGAYGDRVSIFPRKVIIHASPAINLTERLPSYSKDRKAAVVQAMADLEKSYINSIEEANRGEKE